MFFQTEAGSHFLYSFLENAPEAVLIFDLGLSLEWANASFKESILCKSHCQGTKLHEALPSRFGVFLKEKLSELNSQKRRYVGEFQEIENPPAWYEIRAERAANHFVVFLSDVTKEKLQNRTLEESEELFRLAFERAAIGMCFVSLDARFIRANEKLCEMFGYPLRELLRIPVSAVSHPEDYDKERREFHALLIGELDCYRSDKRYIRSDGSILWCSLSCILKRDDYGNPQYYIASILDISEKKKSEMSLIESEERFRMIADTAPVMLWMSGLDKNVYYVNKRWLDFTHRSLEQEVGNGWLEGVHPEDLERVWKTYSSHYDQRASFKMEYRLRRYDGQYRWILDQGIPRDGMGQFLGFVGICIDIDDRKQAEQAIVRSEARVRGLVDANIVGVAFVDKSGAVIEANRSFLQLLGYTREGESWTCSKILSVFSEDKDFEKRLQREIKSYGRCAPFETVFVRADGSEVPVLVGMALLDSREEEQVIVALDLSERKQIEAMRRAKESAELASKQKSDFLANMSHEIRTPLGAISGFAELLADPSQSDAERANAVTIIRRNCESLADIINEILDLSKVEAGRMDVEFSPFSVESLIDSVMLIVGIRAQEKGIKVSIECVNAIPSEVVSDMPKIRQILVNLLGNAIKFTEKGEVKILLEWQKKQEDELGELSFRVRDTGIGLTMSQREGLFQPFMQADTSIRRRYGGTGLGLALSRRLAELLGGSVALTFSAPGQGSEFLLSLPLKRTNKGHFQLRFSERISAASTDLPSVGAQALPPLGGISVLYVEDAPDNRTLMGRVLKLAGAKVEFAVNGKEGVEKALASEYDVILMDLQMPEVDGYEATRLLRISNLRTPIIAVTAHAMKEERERVLSAGFDNYLTKPINRVKLVETIRDHLAQGAKV